MSSQENISGSSSKGGQRSDFQSNSRKPTEDTILGSIFKP